MGAGVRQGLTYGEVKELRLILPSFIEIEPITSFLEKQCSKIDGLIADAKQSIDEYKKWKTSIIFEAVTKGINPNSEMKDSEVDWIGKMPKHWTTKRLKFVMDNHDARRIPIEASARSQKGEALYDYYGASGVVDKVDDYIFYCVALA